MSGAPVRVAVVGAGLSGLCLAQRLRSADVDVTVYEQNARPTTTNQGYRLSLKEQGATALQACLPPPLFQLLIATALRPAQRLFFAEPDLTVHLDKSLPVSAAGPQGMGVNRVTLHEVLRTGVEDLIRDDLTFERYRAASTAGFGPIEAHFSGGVQATADLLVGADGTHSAVRRQLIPSARFDDLGWAIYGRTPLSEAVLGDIDERLVDAFAQIKDGHGRGIAVATCRPFTPIGDAVARFAPHTRLTEVEPYLQWIVSAEGRRPPRATPADLHALAGATIGHWHPALRNIVAGAQVSATFAVTMRSALPVDRWTEQRVTLLGDAVHTMSPGRGDGANVALWDARVLGDLLADRPDSASIPAVTTSYERQMLEYGFAAVRTSRTAPFAFTPRRRDLGPAGAPGAPDGPGGPGGPGGPES